MKIWDSVYIYYYIYFTCKIKFESVLGTVFDSTYEEGRKPLEIAIGASGIKGWDLALSGACKGEKRTVFVPAELGYGEKGVEKLVPPNAALILEIEILEYQDRVIGFLERFSSGTFKG